MFWLEMSRDATHGNGDWGFAKCLWSPSRKKNGARWSFWETVFRVRDGDVVLHLLGDKNANFVGFSTADGDGFETFERPPIEGQWTYARTFYRANLVNYQELEVPINLSEAFEKFKEPLTEYFLENKSKDRLQKRLLFYVIQRGKLQCQNGAYLSEVDEQLLEILLPSSSRYHSDQGRIQQTLREVNTAEKIRGLKTRIGQERFSAAVRSNYGHSCCFPDCDVSDDRFLVAGHISRWADDEANRGQPSNGVCFCLMHDKAFEAGFFTIRLDETVWVNLPKANQSTWALKYLVPYHGNKIKKGMVKFSDEAIKLHWARHHLEPV